MGLKIIGANSFFKKTAKQRALIKGGAADFVRSRTKSILRDLVLNTPQWSGNTAAMWRIQTNSVEAGVENSPLYSEDWKDVDAKRIGDKTAYKVALAYAQPALKSIRYNSTVTIENYGPYTDELATLSEEELKLRKGNYIPGDVMAVNLATAKYKLSSNIVGLQLKQVMEYE